MTHVVKVLRVELDDVGCADERGEAEERSWELERKPHGVLDELKRTQEELDGRDFRPVTWKAVGW